MNLLSSSLINDEEWKNMVFYFSAGLNASLWSPQVCGPDVSYILMGEIENK